MRLVKEMPPDTTGWLEELHAAHQDDDAFRAHLAWLESLGLDWLSFDRAAGDGDARLAAQVWPSRPAHSRSKDILLAGHAYALGAGIATLNPRDFDLVADLVPPRRGEPAG